LANQCFDRQSVAAASLGDTWRAMSQENVDTVYRIAAALARRDVAFYLEVSDPEVEWHTSLSVVSEGGAYHGHEGIRQYMSDIDETFDSFEATLDKVLDVGDLVLAVGRLHYRGKASGVEMDAQLGWIFRFREGKLVSLRAFRDPENALAAVGLTEYETRRTPAGT
jgi:ketosteroid isomerase-like protein